MGDETMSTGDPICPICKATHPHWHYVDINRWGDSPFIKLESTIGETITESEIWADIDKVFRLPARELGDIDIYQWKKRYDVSETSARRQMNKLVNAGEWQWLKVIDDSCINRYRMVIRRVK